MYKKKIYYCDRGDTYGKIYSNPRQIKESKKKIKGLIDGVHEIK